jgi:hypothetical protein
LYISDDVASVIANSVIMGNDAGTMGGGIFESSTGTHILKKTPVQFNYAPTDPNLSGDGFKII